VAALCGALAGALTSMVANLTVGRAGQEDVWAEMISVAESAQAEKDAFLRAVDEDTAAFNRVMDAIRIRARTDEEKAAKEEALREANRGATLVPLGVLERTLGTLDLARTVAEKGNPNSLSDAGVAGLTARAAAHGAAYNVYINLNGLDGDDAWSNEIRAKAERLVTEADRKADELASRVEERLRPGAPAKA
jgi:glutamate formiminotransferase/formiminotetrahydrofolate cyclodeaminase